MSAAVAIAERQPVARPFLKWAGGKRRLLPQLFPLLPASVDKLRLVEPFCGSGAMFFGLAPDRALLADLNTDLIHTYRQVRGGYQDLCEQLEVREREFAAARSSDDTYVIKGMERSADAAWYDRLVAAFNQDALPLLGEEATLQGSARAAAFIAINKSCVNGLWRVSRTGDFTTGYCHPRRHGTSVRIFDREALGAAHHLLQGNVELQCQSFEETVAACGRGDFVFSDSPYWAVSKTADFDSYTTGRFTASQHARLRDELERAAKRGAKVMVTASFTPAVLELYSRPGKWDVTVVERQGSMNSDRSKRGAVKEYVFRSYR